MSVLADSWQVRTENACVLFRGRAARLLPTVQARFTSVTGTLSATTVDVDVDVRSLTTGNRAYDELLAAADPFDAQRHPVASYRSEDVLWVGEDAVVSGSLQLRGRSAPVQLRATYAVVEDGVARLSATGRVDRRAFGLRLDVPGCGGLVPSHLDLVIDVTAERFVPQPPVLKYVPSQR